MFRAYVMPAIAAASLLGLATAALAVTGEFGNKCAMSLANGKDTPTDCSINDSYKGHTYCFGSEDAHKVFMKSPDENLAKAQANYATMFKTKAQEK